MNEDESLKEHFDNTYAGYGPDEKIPEHMKESLDRYVYHRIPPGGFLTAVLENDFKGAVGRADNTNLTYLKQYTIYICNCVPSDCQGSPEKVNKWLRGDE